MLSLWMFFGFGIVLGILVATLVIIAQWKIYTKAGRPGWACLIPVYSDITMLKICKMSPWLLLLNLLPLVNDLMVIFGYGMFLVSMLAYVIPCILSVMICIKLAHAFGKGEGFAVGLMLIPLIFYPILAFGNAQYQKEEDEEIDF